MTVYSTDRNLKIAENCRKHGSRKLVTDNGATFATAHHMVSTNQTNGNARLLAAAYNALDSAAKKMGVNAVLLAEAMADGGIAELVETLARARDWINDECERRGKEDVKYDSPASAMVTAIDSAIAKVRGAS
jgi:hypothetical protein